MINRLALVAAFCGMLLTVHIWIQDQRGFDRGCWGLGNSVAADSVCGDPALRDVSFLSLRPAVWGYLFYSTMALVGMVKTLGRPGSRIVAHRLGLGLAGLSLFQTGYLLYLQFDRAHGFCPLCLISAGLVCFLTGLYAWETWRQPSHLATSADGDTGFVLGGGFATVAGIAALLLAAQNLGAPAAATAGSPKLAAGTAVPSTWAPSWTSGTQAKASAPAKKGPVIGKIIFANWEHWGVPSLNRKTDLSMVVFMDPNCPHCAQTFAFVKELAREFDGQASFYIFPRILWEYSTLQAQALEVARQSGKYYEMWQAQFDLQTPAGLKPEEVKQLATKLGLPMDEYEDKLMAARRAVTIISQNSQLIGVDVTPTWFIDGTRPEAENRNPEGIRKLVVAAIAAHPPKAADSGSGLTVTSSPRTP